MHYIASGDGNDWVVEQGDWGQYGVIYEDLTELEAKVLEAILEDGVGPHFEMDENGRTDNSVRGDWRWLMVEELRRLRIMLEARSE